MSTVYGIIKQSCGSIWVYSESGRGTTFKIYLPRTSQPLGVPRVETKADTSVSGNETILLVEDEESVRKFMRGVLEGYGYRVLVADSGHAAIELGEQQRGRIQLLLTDVVMPEMDGHALSRRLLQAMPDVKVLYMSGHTPDTTAHFAATGQRSRFIQKPFSPDVLARKVREILDLEE